MHYVFPNSLTLDEVRNVVSQVDGFIVAEREWGWVVNYVQMGAELFPDVTTAGSSQRMRDAATREKAIRRECRGLIFNTSGELISRPLHKFFNVNERQETMADNIDLSAPHVILEKLDGSMIRPIPLHDGYRLGTKMGVTDVSMQAEVFVSDKENYDQFIRQMIKQGCTPIFEWCSRKQRIVIDYPVDRLVLIAVRNVATGEYTSYQELLELGHNHDIEVVRAYQGTVANMQHLMHETHDLKGQEGWVIRWNDGHMTKLKAAEYVTIHKAKDNILRERGVLELILDEKLDDVKPFLLVEDKLQLETYESSFWSGLKNTAYDWNETNQAFRNQYGDNRKAFAIEMAPQLESNLRSAIFTAWDKENYDFLMHLVGCVRKNIGTQTKINEVRHLWGGAQWNLGVSGDE